MWHTWELVAVIIRAPHSKAYWMLTAHPSLSRKEICTRLWFPACTLRREWRPRLGHWENKWFLPFHTRPLTHNAPEMPLKYKTGAKKKKKNHVSHNVGWKHSSSHRSYLPFLWKWMFVSLYTLCVVYGEVRNKFTCVWSCPELVLLGLKLVRIELGSGTAIMN